MSTLLEILSILVLASIFYLGFYFFRKLSSKIQSIVIITFLAVFTITIWLMPSNSSVYVRSIISFLFFLGILSEVLKLKKRKKS
jgi:hypothetical protein